MNIERPKIGLMIPTYNAGNQFSKVLARIASQNTVDLRKIIIDSQSVDNTVTVAKKYGFEIYSIDRSQFTHGLVRERATEILRDCDLVFFMTQDAYLHQDALKNMLSFIERHPQMMVAYGRQVVDVPGENYFDKKDREFNYPKKSLVKSQKDIAHLGIKTVFSSDTFSVYRQKYLRRVGGFPGNVKFAEDMYMAAQAIKSNYEVGYCATAIVTHTNGLNYRQQFKRYYNIGKFHAENRWIERNYGSNEKNGIALVLTQTKDLLKSNRFSKIPELYFRSFIKYCGYQFGKL
ncbi:glycosyltransferase family 2 protein [Lactobacillus plantarum]|uniref:glycosyltransferase family 2 protein n=1 Tax=Lactiplantibacillus plantarum TaxID=1590 RepID=UPI0013D4D4B8|nr:glycosyltransferase family 2 protein [Lactiplantibacillus plantarum]NFA51344.1 glycosyltransferase family 2 protein [Lactiplantibacillus plantarum]